MVIRLDYRRAAPAAIDALAAVNRYLDAAALPRTLRLLVEIRVSQLNGCAYCVDLHTRQARSGGENQQRLDCLGVWRDVDLFDARERAALAWAEALTLCAATAPPDANYDRVRERFDDKELVEPTLAVAGINAWNRIGVGFRPRVVASRTDA